MFMMNEIDLFLKNFKHFNWKNDVLQNNIKNQADTILRGYEHDNDVYFISHLIFHILLLQFERMLSFYNT